MVSKTLTAVTVRTPIEVHPDLRFLPDYMNDYLVEFALNAGLTLDVEEDDDDAGQTYYYLTPSPADCSYAARQPVTVACVLADLCARIGVQPPAAVTAALDDSNVVH